LHGSNHGRLECVILSRHPVRGLRPILLHIFLGNGTSVLASVGGGHFLLGVLPVDDVLREHLGSTGSLRVIVKIHMVSTRKVL
jgi:hypothetical protein